MEEYYRSLSKGTPRPAEDVVYALSEMNKEDADTADVLGAAASSAFVGTSMVRMFERRSSQFERDPLWEVDDDMEKQLVAEYSPDDVTYLKDAKSSDEFVSRKATLKEDDERDRRMIAGGWTGVAARVGFELIDPVSWGMGFATGGIGWLKKGSGIIRAVKLGTTVGLENVAIESMLMAGDTNSEASNLIMAFGAGSVIGGTLGALSKRVDSVRVADEIDNAISIDAESHIIKRGILDQLPAELRPIRMAFPDADARAIQADIDEAFSAIREGRESPVGTEAQQLSARKAVAGIEKEIAEAVSELDSAVSALRGKMPKKALAQKKALKRIADLEDTHAKKIKQLTEKMTPFKANLGEPVVDAASKQELRAWERMTIEEKVEALYGKDGPPSRSVESSKQMIPIKEVDPVAPKPKETDVQDGLAGEGKAGSVGAAEAGFTDIHYNEAYKISEKSDERINRLISEGLDGAEEVRGSMLPFRSRVTDAIHAAHTLISNSKSYAMRGFGHMLFEAPQGGKAGAATAAIRKQVYDNKIRGAMRNRLNEGLYEFGEEEGLSKFQSLMNQKHIDKYNKAVMIEVMRPGTHSSPAIVKGAAGTRDQLLAAGTIRKEAGEAGFENMDLNRNYVPVIQDANAIKRALVGGKHPQSRVRGVMSMAYQKGGFKLDPGTADRLADVQIKRALDDTLVMSEQSRGVTNKDMDELAKGLKKAGVEQSVIDDIINDSLDAEVKKHMSNRAKKSMLPRIDVEFEGLKFIDLIENDLPKILESYTRDAAGGAAFARMGYTTRSQVLDQLRDLEVHAAQRTNMTDAQIKREIEILRDGVDMVYGRTLNKSDPRLVKAFSRMRSMAGLLRLQFVGAASIPELARVTSQYSIDSVLEASSSLGAIRGTKHMREGGKYSGHMKRKDLDELEEVMYYSGEDSVLYPNGLRADDIEESEFVGRLGRYFDRAAAQGRRLQEVSSGFRAIQGTGERLAVRSLALDIKKMIAGTTKDAAGNKIMTKGSLSKTQINDAGWSDGFLDELGDFMKANPKTTQYDGKELTLFNFGKMPPDMQERLQIGMHRLVRRDMQRPNIGETPMFMNKWLGQTFTQFRSFSILSMEKQLVHDFKHDKAMGALIAMQSAMYGIVGAGLASMQRNIGKEDAWDRIENDMTGTNLVMGVMNRMGQIAALGIGTDFLATVGALPDGMMSKRDQVGARAMTSDSVPVLGLVKDALEVPKSVFGAISGDVSGSKVIKDIQDVTPFGKTIGINQAINVLRGSLDD